MDLVEEIEESGSGARNDRPGLRRVLELARTGKIDAVLVWKWIAGVGRAWTFTPTFEPWRLAASGSLPSPKGSTFAPAAMR